MTIPENEQYQPRSIASSTRQGARKQWRITGDRRRRSLEDRRRRRRSRVVSPSGSRAWMTIGRPKLGGRSRSGRRRRRRCSSRRRRLAVVVDAGLADRPHPLVPGEPPDFGGELVVEFAGAWSGGSRRSRRPPRGARRRRGRPGCVSAPSPTLSIRRTPASSAAATRSSSSPSQRKRWVWESITAMSLGSNSLRPCPIPPTTTARSTSAGWAARRPRSRSRSPSWSGAPPRRWRRARPPTSSPAPATEETMDANRAAFARHRLVPRMLRDVAERDLSTTVLGTEMPAPLLLAPIGVQKIVHEDGELATARAAGALGVPMIASTASHFTLEEIAEACGDGPRWFQLYWSNERRHRRELRPPGRGRRLRRDRRHRRHLHPRLEAARPAAGLAAVPAGDGRRQLLPGPGLPRGPREAAGGGRRRRDRPLPRRLRQPLADLGRPRLAARADLAADPRQGHPARRRRPRGGRPRPRRDRRLQPRRPPGRRRDRLARRPGADRRGGRRRPHGPLRQRHPQRQRHHQGARPRRRRRPPRPPLHLGPRPRGPGRASKPSSR